MDIRRKEIGWDIARDIGEMAVRTKGDVREKGAQQEGKVIGITNCISGGCKNLHCLVFLASAVSFFRPPFLTAVIPFAPPLPHPSFLYNHPPVRARGAIYASLRPPSFSYEVSIRAGYRTADFQHLRP